MIIYFPFLTIVSFARGDMSIFNADNIFPRGVNLQVFAETLDRLGRDGNMIERFDIDRPDPDNFTAVLLRIFQRRQLGVSGTRVISASQPLHVVLIGRKFSSKLSHMVFSPTEKAFAMEVYDDPAAPSTARIELVPPPKLGGYIKQALWEEGCWDAEEEELLLHLNAAHLRSFLGAAGVMPWEYVLYDGGFAKLAGLSCHVHAYDFAFFKDPTCASFGVISGAEHTAFCAEWRSLSVADRAARFRARALAPPSEARALLPLEAFHAACREAPALPVTVYLGSPLTALAATVRDAPDVTERVVFISAMSTAWDGSQVCTAFPARLNARWPYWSDRHVSAVEFARTVFQQCSRL
jgi:hypothetical protein